VQREQCERKQADGSDGKGFRMTKGEAQEKVMEGRIQRSQRCNGRRKWQFENCMDITRILLIVALLTW
jgi:hypothetical protein